jgi:hypothetical protein
MVQNFRVNLLREKNTLSSTDKSILINAQYLVFQNTFIVNGSNNLHLQWIISYFVNIDGLLSFHSKSVSERMKSKNETNNLGIKFLINSLFSPLG